ncbi:aldo/keto reductase [Halorientalis litorea]|jgi:aryl-alcohol dehydrogenase-like predicted oxidoreductase|uniref:aldo/keto reductase n=1 Tax=Halorientalis litorea TaxID=2931977 RepID=UPI001FF51748|nr:aldo/keto reductase [Halorientalis litorea]
MDAELSSVSLGRTGLQVSELCFGTWRFGRETDAGRLEIGRDTAMDLLDAYADAGGRFIDTADYYGDGDSERWIGEWLADRDREDYVVASKVYLPVGDGPNRQGLGRKHIRRQIDRTLDRLDTDYVDVLYIHRWDDDVPVREFMRTLDGLVRDGRVHYLGASTLVPNAWKVTRANELACREGFEPFTVTQPRYNLVNREIEGPYLEMCEAYGLGVCPWSPLGQGFLTGKYERDGDVPESSTAADRPGWADRYLTAENFDTLDVVREVAAETGGTPTQVALAWLLAHPGVTAPIVGARTVEQLTENLGAAAVSLTDDQFDRLSAAADGPFAALDV